MSTTTPAEAALLRTALQAIVDAVKEAGSIGAPGGVIYSALIGKVSLRQFESIMGALVKAGKLRRGGDLYYFVADL